MVLYNVACLYTTQGNPQRALELLEEAVRLGFGDRAWMETDSDLEPLRSEPRFQALLASIHWWSNQPSRPHSWTRSEEHTSELQSLMRISYAVFCLKKKQ